jgi:transposase
MGYLGLVPSEHSSGGTIRRGGITKTGNREARRMLIEAAWSYQYPARIAKEKARSSSDYPRRFAISPGKHRPGYVLVIAR